MSRESPQLASIFPLHLVSLSSLYKHISCSFLVFYGLSSISNIARKSFEHYGLVRINAQITSDPVQSQDHSALL